jgi:hypothetical protein
LALLLCLFCLSLNCPCLFIQDEETLYERISKDSSMTSKRGTKEEPNPSKRIKKISERSTN